MRSDVRFGPFSHPFQRPDRAPVKGFLQASCDFDPLSKSGFPLGGQIAGPERPLAIDRPGRFGLEGSGFAAQSPGPRSG